MTNIEYVDRVVYEIKYWLNPVGSNYIEYYNIQIRWVFKNSNKLCLVLLNMNDDKKKLIINKLKEYKLNYNFKNHNNRTVLTITKKIFNCSIL